MPDVFRHRNIFCILSHSISFVPGLLPLLSCTQSSISFNNYRHDSLSHDSVTFNSSYIAYEQIFSISKIWQKYGRDAVRPSHELSVCAKKQMPSIKRINFFLTALQRLSFAVVEAEVKLLKR